MIFCTRLSKKVHGQDVKMRRAGEACKFLQYTWKQKRSLQNWNDTNNYCFCNAKKRLLRFFWHLKYFFIKRIVIDNEKLLTEWFSAGISYQTSQILFTGIFMQASLIVCYKKNLHLRTSTSGSLAQISCEE